MSHGASVSSLLSLLLGIGLSAAAETPPEANWDMDSFARVVQPMQAAVPGRLPLFLWNFPIPRNDQLVKLREDGTLRKWIDLMAARGVVPTVEMGWEWTPAGALAMAKTLQEAKQPVFVLIPPAEFVEEAVYKNCTAWGEGPDATRKNQTRKWPCLPLADTRAGADRVRQLLRPYKEAGIPLAGVWFDDEALPHPWNGCFEAQRGSAECRKHYPPGILDAFAPFCEHVYNLRSKVLNDVMADPVIEMFPGALVGNYGEFASSKEVPFEGLRPPRTLGRLVLMPSAYANTLDLARQFKDGQGLTQEKADQLYFHSLLKTVSTCNANKKPGQVSIPFLSAYCPDNPDPRFRFGMSRRVFRELIRHVWLRGADSIYVFNLGYPTTPQLVTPQQSFESVADVRAAFDELLGWRQFRERGEPMSFSVPEPINSGPIWSGVRLEDTCYVRAFTFGAVQKFEIEAFPGVRVQVTASPAGENHFIRREGR